jgi:hypothetical protein
MPYADTEAMQLHLEEISRAVARGAHAVLLLDRAGWHTTANLLVPKNLTLIFLPSRAPELNPVENIWQYLRQTWLSARVFDTYEAVVEAACEAWNKLLAQPATITVHRTQRLGAHQSDVRAVGITSRPVIQGSSSCGQLTLHARPPERPGHKAPQIAAGRRHVSKDLRGRR